MSEPKPCQELTDILRLLNEGETCEALREFRVMFGMVNRFLCKSCGLESAAIRGSGCVRCGSHDFGTVIVMEPTSWNTSAEDSKLAAMEADRDEWKLKAMKSQSVTSMDVASLEHENAALKSRLENAEFWHGVYPDGWTKERVENEMKDFRCLIESVPIVYMEVTGGRISKPLTHPNCVIAEYEDHLRKLIDEETAETISENATLQARIAELETMAGEMLAMFKPCLFQSGVYDSTLVKGKTFDRWQKIAGGKK